MNLYTIEQELLSIYGEIEDNEGEITEEIEERLKITEQNFKFKIENYCKFIRLLEGDANLAQEEISRIARYIAVKLNTIDRLKSSVVEALKLFGDKDKEKDIWRLQVGTFKLGTRKSVSTIILDPTAIEDKFRQIAISKLTVEDKLKILNALQKSPDELKIEETIPLTPIKNAIDAGEVVNGAELKTSYHLNLK